MGDHRFINTAKSEQIQSGNPKVGLQGAVAGDVSPKERDKTRQQWVGTNEEAG